MLRVTGESNLARRKRVPTIVQKSVSLWVFSGPPISKWKNTSEKAKEFELNGLIACPGSMPSTFSEHRPGVVQTHTHMHIHTHQHKKNRLSGKVTKIYSYDSSPKMQLS